MLVKFTIHSVKKTKRQYEYQDVGLGGKHCVQFGKLQKAWEWEYEITSTDGDKYFLFHEKKPDPTIRQYRNCYGNARKMVSESGLGGSKYSEQHEGGYKLEWTRHPIIVKALDTKEVFEKALKLQIELEKKRVEHSQNEIARLEKLL